MKQALFSTILVLCMIILGCSTDSDTDGETNPDCDGTGLWYDSSSGLCWQESNRKLRLDWQSAINHCDTLSLGSYSDWRMPEIQELTSLIRGCESRNCEVTDPDCLSDICIDGPNCDYCNDLEGPGLRGCYWDAALSGSCDVTHFWSSSTAASRSDLAWYVYFDNGEVHRGGKDNIRLVRCVRSIP